MKSLICFLLLLAPSAWACRPRADFEPPTLADNYKKAASIFLGTVVSQETEGFSGRTYKLAFKPEKSWKGSPAKKVIVITETSTCNPFGQMASKGSVCLVFLTADGSLMAGLLAGDASTCFPPEAAANHQQMIAEFEAKLSLIPKSK